MQGVLFSAQSPLAYPGIPPGTAPGRPAPTAGHALAGVITHLAVEGKPGFFVKFGEDEKKRFSFSRDSGGWS